MRDHYERSFWWHLLAFKPTAPFVFSEIEGTVVRPDWEMQPLISKGVFAFDVFDMFDLARDKDAALSCVSAILQPHLIASHAQVAWKCRPGTVLTCISDAPLPADGKLICGGVQVVKPRSYHWHFCFPYPVLSKEKIIALRNFEPPPMSKRSYDIGFVGWNGRGWLVAPEIGFMRRQLEPLAKRWKLKTDYALYNGWEGSSCFLSWLKRASMARINLVLPGVGANSWRMSELFAAGLFSMLVGDAANVDFDPPVLADTHCAVADYDTIVEQAMIWLDDIPAMDRAAQRAREWAESACVGDAWRGNTRRLIDKASDAWIRHVTAFNARSFCS